MRTLTPSLRTHLAQEEITLCRCWLIIRRDGKKIALTEHDQTLVVHGQSYEPGGGIRGSAVEYNAQLARDGLDILAAFDTEQLTKDDLLAGLYDGARLQLWLVNWQNPEDAVQLNQGYFAQVRQQGETFQVELDGAFAPLQRKDGRVFQRSCDAQLGDARCGVNLYDTKYRYTARLHSWQSEHKIIVNGNSNMLTQYLVGGYFHLSSDIAATKRYYIRSEQLKDDPNNASGPQLRELDLWTAFAQPSGTTKPNLTFVVGCDKTINTCGGRFNNAKNFRGCPYMPSEKILVRPAV